MHTNVANVEKLTYCANLYIHYDSNTFTLAHSRLLVVFDYPIAGAPITGDFCDGCTIRVCIWFTYVCDVYVFYSIIMHKEFLVPILLVALVGLSVLRYIYVPYDVYEYMYIQYLIVSEDTNEAFGFYVLTCHRVRTVFLRYFFNVRFIVWVVLIYNCKLFFS